jgi:hypothetical protein
VGMLEKQKMTVAVIQKSQAGNMEKGNIRDLFDSC